MPGQGIVAVTNVANTVVELYQRATPFLRSLLQATLNGTLFLFLQYNFCLLVVVVVVVVFFLKKKVKNY